MSKTRLAMILVVAVMMLITAAGCKIKPTKPEDLFIDMVYVPGGSFTMGDTRGGGNEDELPTHTVTLNHFYIGRYEVTQSEYSEYLLPDMKWDYTFGRGKRYPAYNVSWYAAIRYCNLRSLAEKLTPCYSINGSTNPSDWSSIPTENNSATWDAVVCDFSASGYRLPTEAEWEYAARGARDWPDYLYSGSDSLDTVAWSGGSVYTCYRVGTKEPNGLGIYDMSGNLWEWCWDWYDESYYESSPQANPTGPETSLMRVKRGGFFCSNAEECRVSSRWSQNPYTHIVRIGFRVCRSIVE
ncbi:MAG TPA: SUMF1/EgtB/PvdO family nonheme iron enzyme [Candidatus Cloacimonadota bacterium]|nr:SUMF1/EgtB/PvdO family nonheme iron enzyme [Candidatus Cloacimonadota bacterium]